MHSSDLFSLSGKVALITGGAGLYGRQIVAALAEAGAVTYMASRGVDALESLAAEHRERGHDVHALALDQGDEASVLAVRDRILAEQGQIDVLINNAVSRPMRSWHDPIETFAESMRVNATGVFAVTRAIGDVMAARGSGSILNIASIQGHVGPDAELYKDLPFTGFIPDYFFHKGGMINLTRFIASYYGPQGVRCNSLSPGGFYSGQDPVFVERYAQRTMLGRMAGDSDLQGAVVFFASDASRYITGTDLPIDGGYTAK